MRRYRWWIVFLLLLGASHVTQALLSRPSTADSDDPRVTALPRVNRDGPTGGDTVLVFHHEFTAPQRAEVGA